MHAIDPIHSRPAITYAGRSVGHFNGDGRPDAVTANACSGTVSVLLNNGIWPVPGSRLTIGDPSVLEGNAGTGP